MPTPLQQACVARSLLAPSGGHYLQQLVCDWSEPLQTEAWKSAWDFVAGRHEALRASFHWNHTGEMVQQFAAVVVTPVEIVRADSNTTDREQLVADFLRNDRTRGFNLAAAPLWRLTIFPWTDREFTSVWIFHHSLLDGRSHLLVWQEVETVYRAILNSAEPVLSPAKPFREFPAWLASVPTEAAATYWRECLRGFQAAIDLPTLSSSPDSGDDDFPPAMETRVLPAEVVVQLKNAAERHGVTLNNLVQGAWALALARYQAVEEIVFGVVRSGRHWTDDDPNGRVGMFINTIPFRVDASPSQPVGEWLRGLRAQQLAARAGEHASAEQIRRWCGLPRSAVLFRTCVMFENRDPSERLTNAGQHVRLIEKTDLPTFVAYAGKVLTLTLDYSPRRHPAAQMQIILRHLQTLLEALASAPGHSLLGELNMLSPEDRRLMFDKWQGPTTAQLAPPLHMVLEAQAAKTPEAPAVEFKGQSITYSELHRRANQLARRLLQFCQPGARVAVVLDRAFEQPIVWLAALKAGLVYAPVDPANPRERLEFYFDDLQPGVLLTQTELLPHLPVGKLRMLCLDAAAERATLAALDASHLAFDPPVNVAANLLYTSGSTGVPKAAINSRFGLDNFALELKRSFDFGPDDRVLQSSATSFDASLFDFVAAFQSGGTLVLVPSDQLRPGPNLTRMLIEQRISVTLLTPTVMRSTPAPQAPAVRILISAGEPLTTDLLARWSAGRRLFNVCGPTECSVWFNCEESRADGNRPTIGALVANCRGYVLDDDRQPVPVGVPGELYLGGAGVGLGYWNRAELTAEKYLPDPFAGKPSAVMYRTGDRVRWLADGRIEYLGRLDFQVKVRGVRVELGEIEAAMRRHPAVADAALALHEDQLLAWFVPRGQTPSDASLRAWLADHIPLIFTPAEFHALPQFPRTRTGKADRAALMATWLVAQTKPENPPAAELSATERKQIVEEWNQTGRPFPLDRSVVDFFHEQVVQRPEAIAPKAGAKVVSYTALNRHSNRIAHQLLQAGLQPEDIVALRFERSIAFVVSALAVLKAGGSYLPLDVNIPAVRLSFVLKDSGARFALVAKQFLSTFAEWSGWIASVDDDDATTNDAAPANPAVPSDPRRRAYIIYTSGSTGQPKGVEIEHRSLTNLVCFYHERLQLTSADRTTLLANPTFDASVADLWPALCAGGTVLVPDRSLLGDPDGLIAWLANEGATFAFVLTALGELMFPRSWPPKIALRFLCVGGETLRTHPPAGLAFSVINSYGPTENTVDATWEMLSLDNTGVSGQPSIGRPIANVRAYVLDDALKPVAIGAPGKLFLGGAQVARGYLNRAELTAERFLPDPFTSATNARMYRTGDRVCWRPGGSLEFLGRNDDQVQVRGQRVELGEIEAVLRQHPGVREVCCRPLFDQEAANHAHAAHPVSGVVAHVVMPDFQDEKIAPELQQFLEPLLPGYMVPAIFVSHPALPLTVQGKLDRIALDAMVQARITQSAAAVTAASDDSLVRAMTELWHRILPDGVGARADQTFQELGGDSLGAVKLLLGVEDITGRRLALSTFLLEPTLAGLCRAVAAAEAEARTSILALHRAGTRPPLFCLYELTGDVGRYFELAAELGEDQPVFGIRSPALHDLERVPDSMEAAARQVRAWLREFWPTGPFALVGFSWGGQLAFEVARQYAHDEGFNPFCGLFGTSAPPRRPSLAVKFVHALRWLPSWAWRLMQDNGHRWERIRTAFLSARFLRNLVAEEKLLFPAWANTPLSLEFIKLGHRYQPTISRPVSIHLFREHGTFLHESHPANFALTDHLGDGGWRHWAGCEPEVHWLDGDHMMVLKRPQVTRTPWSFVPRWKNISPQLPRPAIRPGQKSKSRGTGSHPKKNCKPIEGCCPQQPAALFTLQWPLRQRCLP